MKHARTIALLAGSVALLSTSAYAALNVLTTTDLNIRGGPGAQYEVIGMIPANGNVAVQGCMQDRKWCQVAHNGVSGWAYADYLIYNDNGQGQQVVALPPNQVPVVEFNGGGAAGAVTGAIAGALIGGPPGALIGGIVGATAGTAINPPVMVRTYVASNRSDPVLLDGEVVVGATVPGTVKLNPIPDYEYQYVYLNQQPVLVDPGTRRIVYIYR